MTSFDTESFSLHDFKRLAKRNENMRKKMTENFCSNFQFSGYSDWAFTFFSFRILLPGGFALIKKKFI